MMLIGSIFASKTYAALSCNVNLSKPKDKFTYKEQFSIYAQISNLQTTKGIIAIGATLSYDTNSLTLIEIEGENKWSDPFHNPSNGKITSFKNQLSTNNENVFKITFEVNEKGKAGDSAWIKIDNFEISDGDEEKNCGGSSINIAIGEPNSNNSEDSNQGGNNQSGNNQSGNKKPPTSSTNKNDKNTTNKEEIPNNNNNEQTNTVENLTTEEPVNDNNIVQNNTIQNSLGEDNREQEEIKKDSKGQFYIVAIVAIPVIIVILLLIKKFWKTN